ncbi:MAG: bifunctional DNA-binding transcriptional regulator/O6-methylguanine-DNA methyltransferase Ada [Sphingomonadaceae bacterium]|nr:bifunctional DNA-binding transcriptional regulator/O6-methylguanine-DNA methyltransferase Ada [Sphingomonadaceae bacterium]
MLASIDEEKAWSASMARDRSYDGRFVIGVLTTGIYCRPSCPARRPKRENVRFFNDNDAAEADGLRPCKRCKPDEVARDTEAIETAVRMIEAAEEAPKLDRLAEAVGYSPFHFQRIFKRAMGVTPAAYARGVRAERAGRALNEEDSVTAAIYEAGYSGPARFYEDSGKRLGMTPSAWRKGGKGVTIRWTTAKTQFGILLVAATDRGICRLAFDSKPAILHETFPNATIERAGDALDELAERAVAAVDNPARPHDLPLDVQGTAFQEAVWQQLTRIPPGETLSYAALAAKAGRPKAVRAAGTACGANPIAVLIPCHRAKRSDGSLGGYAWGLEMKEKLLAKEAGRR